MADDFEVEVAALIRAGAFDRATKAIMENYGSELYGFLVNLMGNETAGGDVFSQTVEDFWRGLHKFGARCSVRTWLYILARHAAARYRRSPWNRGGRMGESHLEAEVAAVRSVTDPWLRTDVKDKWKVLRESLDPDDRILLVLRVDRALDWAEVARVMLGETQPEDAEITRETARLRKRFQLLKDELRKRARAAGLIGDEP